MISQTAILETIIEHIEEENQKPFNGSKDSRIYKDLNLNKPLGKLQALDFFYRIARKLNISERRIPRLSETIDYTLEQVTNILYDTQSSTQKV